MGFYQMFVPKIMSELFTGQLEIFSIYQNRLSSFETSSLHSGVASAAWVKSETLGDELLSMGRDPIRIWPKIDGKTQLS